MREEEHKSIMNFLSREQGALLISGKRGSGKTSAVYTVVNGYGSKLRKENDNDDKNNKKLKGGLTSIHEIIPVVINAPNFAPRQNTENKASNADILELIRTQKLKPRESEIRDIDLEFKREVLKNLVRGLFLAADMMGIANKLLVYGKNESIAELYNRAIAKEVRQEINEQDLQRQQERTQRQTVISLRVVKRLIVIAASFVSALIVSYNPIIDHIDTNKRLINDIFAILIAAIPSTLLAVTWKIEKTATVENERRSSAYYLHDYDIATLESELQNKLLLLSDYGVRDEMDFKHQLYDEEQRYLQEPTLKVYYRLFKNWKDIKRYEIYRKRVEFWEEKVKPAILRRYKKVDSQYLSISPITKYKVIFIIDELDKITSSNEVMNVILSIKILINQSAALFILITDEEFFAKVLESSEERGKTHTLFSERIFMKRPLFKEMEQFIDNIICDDERKKLLEENITFQQFRNYACFASKTYFFDLYDLLRNCISSKNGLLHLRISLNEKQTVQSNLQKALGQIYLQKTRKEDRSDWYKNDRLLDLMYELVSLTEPRIGLEFIIEMEPNFKAIFPGTTSNNRTELLVTDKVEAGALVDLLNYLRVLGYLQSDKDNPAKYKITGNIRNVPKSLSIHTQEQDRYIVQYEKFLYVIFQFASLRRKLLPRNDDIFSLSVSSFEDLKQNTSNLEADTSNILDDYDWLFPNDIRFHSSNLARMYNDIKKEVPTGEYSIDDIIANTELATRTSNNLLNNFIKIVENILRNRKVTGPFQNESYGLEPSFSQILRKQLKINIPKGIPPTPGLLAELVSSNGQQKELLIIQNAPPELRKEMKSIIEKKANLYVLFLTLNTSMTDNFIETINESAGLMRSEVDLFLNSINNVTSK